MLKNWFRRKKKQEPQETPAPERPASSEEVIAKQRRQRAGKPEPVRSPEDLGPQERALLERRQLCANVDGLAEVLGQRVQNAILSEPYPVSVIVYVLDIVRDNVIAQQRAFLAARDAKRKE